MFACRLIVDPPGDAAWNMAVDEALLMEAAQAGTATLRFYQWATPTLSLGYFQRFEESLGHAAGRAPAVVRRLSGGGALVHDRELTYSLALPAGHPATAEPGSIYRIVHAALIETLAGWSAPAATFGAIPTDYPPAEKAEPFLCFARRTAADVVAADVGGGHGLAAKIAGSAQRRWRGAVLQHGAALLEASPLAPELAGIRESLGMAIPADALAEAWGARIARDLGLALGPQTRVDGQLAAEAERLAAEKYGSQSWTCRR